MPDRGRERETPQIAYQPHRPPEAVSQGTGITTAAAISTQRASLVHRLLNGDDALTGIGTAGTDPLKLIVKGRFQQKLVATSHPRSVRKVVKKAMHVDPNQRYADAKKFRSALEQARPHVSWWPARPATGLGWEGIAGTDDMARRS